MFIIQKIFNFIIFPPSIFIVILIASLLLLKNHKKKAIALLISDTILIYFLSIEPVKNLILLPLESYAKPLDYNQKERADLVVILGGGTIEASPEEGGNGSLSEDPFKRALYGLYIAEKYRLPVLYSGGKLFDSQKITEADAAEGIMKKYSKGDIKFYKEDKSRTTYENALYVKEKFNPKKVILVTSAYHMKRSLYIFKKAGVECIPAPTDYKINSWNYTVLSYFPSTGSMDKIYAGLKEYVGLVFYMVKY